MPSMHISCRSRVVCKTRYSAALFLHDVADHVIYVSHPRQIRHADL